MLDSTLRPFINPPLNAMAHILKRMGLDADQVTWLGFFIGILGCLALVFHLYAAALVLILLNRLLDGLDGAVARLNGDGSAYGGYIDIVLDFILYSGVVFAFAFGHPDYALSAAFLIFSFVGSGVSFLAHAILAAKQDVNHNRQGDKSFYYLGGLTEGTETIIVLCLICLVPVYFSWIAVIFGLMCWGTTIGRIVMTTRQYGNA